MLEELTEAYKYLKNNIPKNNIMEEMEKYAEENNVPIVTKDVAEFLRFMVEIKNSVSILEIGTAIGYSGTILASAAKKNGGNLVTIEIDKDIFKKAEENFKKQGLGNVYQILGDAYYKLDEINEKFDFIFIDAAKGKYEDFFLKCYDKLNNGGLIIIDNILFRGYVYKDDYPKRYKTIVKNLRSFIEKLYREYDFIILAFGDGVGMVKKI